MTRDVDSDPSAQRKRGRADTSLRVVAALVILVLTSTGPEALAAQAATTAPDSTPVDSEIDGTDVTNGAGGESAPPETDDPGPLVWIGVGILVAGAIGYTVRRGSQSSTTERD